jgi:hypothetical protein
MIARIKKWKGKIDFQGLSNNPKITMEIILAFKDENWNWQNISAKANINFTKYPDFPWDWSALSVNPNLTIKDIISTKNSTELFEWIDVSRHKNITMIDIENNPTLPWDWSSVSCNPNIRNLDKPWDWQWLSMNPNINFDFIVKFIEKSWCWDFVSMNSAVKMEHVLKHPNLPWDYRTLSLNENITIQDILTHLDKPWCWQAISFSKYVTMQQVYVPWDFYGLSRNPGIKFNDMMENPDKPWNWQMITLNPNITYKIIDENPTCSWDLTRLSMTFENVFKHMKPDRLSELSYYSNTTYNDFIQHPDIPWNWYSISMHPMFLTPTPEEIRKWWASKTICKYIFEAYTNPSYKVCQKRLLKEFKNPN